MAQLRELGNGLYLDFEQIAALELQDTRTEVDPIVFDGNGNGYSKERKIPKTLVVHLKSGKDFKVVDEEGIQTLLDWLNPGPQVH